MSALGSNANRRGLVIKLDSPNEHQSLDLEADGRGPGGYSGAFRVHVSEVAAWPTSLFQPYQSFQTTLSYWVGASVPAIVPWRLSFLNGMTILGFLFRRLNRLLRGRTGLSKGVSFGLIGWLFMGLLFFPLIGLGPFAVGAGLGIAPAMMSLGTRCALHSGWLLASSLYIDGRPLSAVEKLRFGPLKSRLAKLTGPWIHRLFTRIRRERSREMVRAR